MDPRCPPHVLRVFTGLFLGAVIYGRLTFRHTTLDSLVPLPGEQVLLEEDDGARFRALRFRFAVFTSPLPPSLARRAVDTTAQGGHRKRMRISEKLAPLTVLAQDGGSIALGTLWAERAAVLVWVRHFG